MSTLNENKRKLTSIRGMGAALVGFAGWIILYVVFGLIEPNIFTTNNMLNLLRSMAKYLLVGVGQGVILITGNIDLSIGSVVAIIIVVLFFVLLFRPATQKINGKKVRVNV